MTVIFYPTLFLLFFFSSSHGTNVEDLDDLKMSHLHSLQKNGLGVFCRLNRRGGADNPKAVEQYRCER